MATMTFSFPDTWAETIANQGKTKVTIDPLSMNHMVLATLLMFEDYMKYQEGGKDRQSRAEAFAEAVDKVMKIAVKRKSATAFQIIQASLAG